MRSLPIRRLRYKRQIIDHLAAAAEIASQGDAPQLRMRHAEVRRKQRFGMVYEALTLGPAQEFDPLQHLLLQHGGQALAVPQPVLPAGLLQVRQRCNAQPLVDRGSLPGREAWYS